MEYGAECSYPSYIVYETRMLTDAYALETVAFWNGSVFGYAVALATLLVVLAVMHTCFPRRGHARREEELRKVPTR